MKMAPFQSLYFWFVESPKFGFWDFWNFGFVDVGIPLNRFDVTIPTNKNPTNQSLGTCPWGGGGSAGLTHVSKVWIVGFMEGIFFVCFWIGGFLE